MDFTKELLSKFPKLLLRWNRNKNNRIMPWKGERDPYKIWLSEIILQQTRVEQGLKYYQRFLEAFPDIHKLAAAQDRRIFKLWEGLGYYSRCRNLIITARFISKKLNGKFPDRFEDILSLKGVGNYTASAIASFAYNLPYAVVDGNVFRVLSRVFGIKTAIDTTEGKRQFTKIAFELLDKKKPGTYNQALMDFGAVVCKPYPLCSICPVKDYCYAYKNELTGVLPVKSKKTVIRTRWFNYLVISSGNKFFISKRTNKDIWRNLNEFVMIETGKNVSVKKIMYLAEKRSILQKESYSVERVSPVFSQQLSHQKIIGKFVRVKVKNNVSINGYQGLSKIQMFRLAFPRLINSYFEKEFHHY